MSGLISTTILPGSLIRSGLRPEQARFAARYQVQLSLYHIRCLLVPACYWIACFDEKCNKLKWQIPSDSLAPKGDPINLSRNTSEVVHNNSRGWYNDHIAAHNIRTLRLHHRFLSARHCQCTCLLLTYACHWFVSSLLFQLPH